MKKLTFGAVLAFSLASTSTYAGSLADPVVAADVIVADAGGSSAGTVMSILILSLLLVTID